MRIQQIENARLNAVPFVERVRESKNGAEHAHVGARAHTHAARTRLVVVGLAAIEEIGAKTPDEQFQDAGAKHRDGKHEEEGDELVQEKRQHRPAVLVDAMNGKAEESDDDHRH